MTTKQNAIDLANTARSEAANTAKRTIAAIIINWNECVKQAGFTGVFDFPTTGYTRKSQLIADLERCAAQLDDYVEPVVYPAGYTVEQQTREINAALTRVLDVEEAHAEALAFNREHTAALVALSCDVFRSRWGTHAPHHEAMSVIYCHIEALEKDVGYTVKAINAGFNKENAENLVKLDNMLHAAMDRMEIDDAHAEALVINSTFKECA